MSDVSSGAAPLSAALRTATAAAHESAESSSFVTDLIEGRACRAAFVALAVQQLVVYRALEDVLHEHYLDHPLVAPVDDRRLDRAQVLLGDLEVLVAPDVDVRLADGSLPICPATTAYAEVLREEHSPELVLANHYVRYLGDLSGGQIIARLVQRHYGVEEGGLGFYRFDGIPKPKVYKDGYRAAMDRIAMTPAQREETLARAVQSFGLNQAIFHDLASARAPRHAAAGLPA